MSEDSMVARVARAIYQTYFQNGRPENCPELSWDSIEGVRQNMFVPSNKSAAISMACAAIKAMRE